MVSILIRLLKYFRKLENGILLDDNELKIVRSYLGLRFSLYQARGIFFPILFLILSIIILVANKDFYFFSIVFVLAAIISFFYFIPIYPQYFRKKYNEKLLLFLKKYLEPNDYKIKYVSYMPHTAYEISKNTAYFCYDDYYFKIIEDLLNYERYSIGKKEVLFKYPDYDSLNKKPISFKLSDIVSYCSNYDLEYKEDNYQDLIDNVPSDEPCLKINLKNFKSIYISGNLINYFRQIIPHKEVNNS